MRRIILLACFIGVGIYWLHPVHSHTSNSISREILRELLNKPAPPPRNAIIEKEKKDRRPEDFDYTRTPLPDDADLQDLIDFWKARGKLVESGKMTPSPATSARLLDACKADISLLPELLPAIGEADGVAEFAKALLEAETPQLYIDESWQDRVYEWLKLNTRYYQADLTAIATKTKTDDGRAVFHSEELAALAKLDWSAAEPILQKLSENNQPNVTTSALELLFKHASVQNDSTDLSNYKSRLQSIVEDKQTEIEIRMSACMTLMSTEWSGRDEWFISLFQDQTLLNPATANRPMREIVGKDPDKWIPLLIPLLNSKEQATRDMTAPCLMEFIHTFSIYGVVKPRQDAARALIPWLKNPGWVRSDPSDRRGYIAALGVADLPESIPGLIWIISNEKDDDVRPAAARSLGKYKDPRAIPVLRKAAETEIEEHYRFVYVEALAECGAFTENEIADGLVAYAKEFDDPDDRKSLEAGNINIYDPTPISIHVGIYISMRPTISDSLARKILDRQTILEKTDPDTATTLHQILHRWSEKFINADMIRRIATGRANADDITVLINRREQLRETVVPELALLTETTGAPKGIGHALLEDQSGIADLLGGADRDAQIALLACARLASDSLPIQKVAALLKSSDKDLSVAAQSYLEGEDSPEAQLAVLSHRPNQALILGWLPENDDKHDYVGDFLKTEEKLRKEMLGQKSADEIYALIPENRNWSTVIRVHGGKASLSVYDGKSRYKERDLTDIEMASLREFLSANDPQQLSPVIKSCEDSCDRFDFVTMTRNGGRRVHYVTREYSPAEPMIQLQKLFDEFASSGVFKLHYAMEPTMPGMEILYADDLKPAKDVWKTGQRVLVQVEKDPFSPAPKKFVPKDIDALPPSEEARSRAWANGRERKYEWHDLKDGILGNTTPAPPPFEILEWKSTNFEAFDFFILFNSKLAHAEAANIVIISGNPVTGGLWKSLNRGKPELIMSHGFYSSPIITPDGKWVIAAKSDASSDKPKQAVRIDLQTNKEYPLNIPPALDLDIVLYIDSWKGILLYRTENDRQSYPGGSPAAEFYIADPATGNISRVQGDFRPLCQWDGRLLQRSSQTDKVWVAIPGSNETQIGLYDTATFSFRLIQSVPLLRFESRNMWIDEAEGKAYIVYEGHVVRLPITVPAPNSNK